MKLDAVRRYRAQMEDLLRMGLLHARQNLQDAEAACQALDAQARMTADRYVAKASTGIALEEFLEWQVTCDAEAAMLTQAWQAECRCREEWNQKQQELRDAMQERRTLDRLAERLRRQQRVIQYRAEQLQMDESARRISGMPSSHNS